MSGKLQRKAFAKALGKNGGKDGVLRPPLPFMSAGTIQQFNDDASKKSLPVILQNVKGEVTAMSMMREDKEWTEYIAINIEE